MNRDEKLLALIEKYLQGHCTASEKEEVELWYEQIADHQQVFYDDDKEKIDQARTISLKEIKNKLWDNSEERSHGKIISIRRWYPAAAAVLVMLISALYFFRQSFSDQVVIPKDQMAKLENRIVPGSDQAVLTLADGNQIILNEAGTGQIANQAGITITKAQDGRLIYSLSDVNPSSAAGKLLYNTISTPKGGQYQVVLPDGTRIWLNAASSLRYPASFDSKNRKVELSGEGYFQVARVVDRSEKPVPFVVKTEQQEVEVLGTQFNINAYGDESATVTTLLEGSVRVRAKADVALLEPGEHTVLSGNSLRKGPGDMEGALAWKNGFFFFRKAGIKTVMRQLSRWYNVEVRYEGEVPVREFSGEIYRTASIKQVFNLLDYYKVNYRVESTEKGAYTIVITA